MKRSTRLLTICMTGILSTGSSFVVSPVLCSAKVSATFLQQARSSTSSAEVDKARTDHFDSREYDFPFSRRQRPITKVTTLEQYKHEIGEEKHRMVCVRFFSSSCRACQAAEPMFRRLALEYPTVKFVQVPLLEENTYMLKGLGVPSFPYVHLYDPVVGLVEERRINRKVFSEFQTAFQHYVDGYCLLEE